MIAKKKTVTSAEESDEEDDYEYIEFEDEEDGVAMFDVIPVSADPLST